MRKSPHGLRAVSRHSSYRLKLSTVFSVQGYVDELTAKVSRIPVKTSTKYEIEYCADSLCEWIVSSYENNCNLRKKGAKNSKDWWTPELASLHKKVRKLFNKSSKFKAPEIDEAFRKAQRKYKKELGLADSKAIIGYGRELDPTSAQ